MTQRVTSARLFLPCASPSPHHNQTGTGKTRPSSPTPSASYTVNTRFPKLIMMYFSIIASFCLLGMASSQTISSLTACLTKEKTLIMECMFVKDTKQNAPPVKCAYKIANKVVATTDKNVAQDSSYKDRATANITGDVCVLSLTSFEDELPKTFNCTIQQQQEFTASQTLTVEKKTKICSAANTLYHGGVILLLAFVLPLLSGML